MTTADFNLTSVAVASALRCCGPEGCGQKATDSPDRYCIGPACMAWAWASPDEQDGSLKVVVEHPEIRAAWKELEARRNANRSWVDRVLVIIDAEVEEGINEDQEELLGSLEDRLAGWDPPLPDTRRAWLKERYVDEESGTIRCCFEGEKLPDERYGYCGCRGRCGGSDDV